MYALAAALRAQAAASARGALGQSVLPAAGRLLGAMPGLPASDGTSTSGVMPFTACAAAAGALGPRAG